MAALGVTAEGERVSLVIAEGSTESTALARSVVCDFRDRGFDASPGVLFVVDGSKALSRAVCEVFGDQVLVQRCRIHKQRSVLDRLPEKQQAWVGRKLPGGRRWRTPRRPGGRYGRWHGSWSMRHPGAANSLREGLEETLAVTRLGIRGSLLRTAYSTNRVESIGSIMRDNAAQVMHWKNRTMALGMGCCGYGLLRVWNARGDSSAGSRGTGNLSHLAPALEAEVARSEVQLDAKNPTAAGSMKESDGVACLLRNSTNSGRPSRLWDRCRRVRLDGTGWRRSGGPMATFEEAFAASEEAADSVLAALSEMSRLARRLKRGARDGNIAALRREAERLDEGVEQIRARVVEAVQVWPFSPEDEADYLHTRYRDELVECAGREGLQIFSRDDRLIAHPSIVRVLAGDRAIRIDRRRSQAVRPTRVVAELMRVQERPARFQPQAFLKALYDAYLELCRRDVPGTLVMGGVGEVIRLDRIYRLFTGLPGTGREYTQLDFARDLYHLEESGVREVRSGARVSFPASTGTRTPRGTITFIDPSGETVVYYAIRFSGADG